MSDIDALVRRAQALAQAQEGPFSKISTDYWDWQVREPEWLLEKLIPARSIGMVYGPSNSGKSHLVCDIVAAMLAGEGHWQGIPMESGDVVLFSESIGHIRARMKAYMGDREPDFGIYSLPTMSLETRMIYWLAEWIKALPRRPMIIVFDTLATMFAFEENDNREASQLIKLLEELILPLLAPKGAILIIHHTSKISEGKSARGASALIGNIDFSWNVTYDKEANLTIAQWEKDRWRLYNGVSRWAGSMRRVPVQFVNGSCEMAILDWEEWSTETEETTKALLEEGKIDAIKRELAELLAREPGNAYFHIRGKEPVGYAKFVVPDHLRRHRKMLLEWLRDTREHEVIFDKNGTEKGVLIRSKSVK